MMHEHLTRRSFLLGAASSAMAPAFSVIGADYQRHGKMVARYVGLNNGAHRWAYRSPLIDAQADFVSAIDYFIDVVLPDDYPIGGPFPIVFVGPVEPAPVNFGDGLAMLAGQDVHNLYNCVLVSMTTKSMPWYGEKSDGTIDIDSHIMDSVLPLVRANYDTAPGRDSCLFIGFSKSGWGGLSLILRNPDTFGYVAAWDAPWNISSGDYGTNQAFGDAAQFALFNPKPLLQSLRESVSDKARVWIGGGSLFGADYASMIDALDTASIPYLSEYTATTSHRWLNAWVSSAVSAVFSMRAS